MTKKDYELIASVFTNRLYELKAVSSCTSIDQKDPQRIRIDAKFMAQAVLVNDMANQLELNNPKFDRNRFLEACGVTQ